MSKTGFPTFLGVHPFTRFEDDFVLSVVAPKIHAVIEAVILQGHEHITPDFLRIAFCETYGVSVKLLRWRRWLRLLNIKFVTRPNYSRLDPLP
jgi:hypothetical protein